MDSKQIKELAEELSVTEEEIKTAIDGLGGEATKEGIIELLTGPKLTLSGSKEQETVAPLELAKPEPEKGKGTIELGGLEMEQIEEAKHQGETIAIIEEAVRKRAYKNKLEELRYEDLEISKERFDALVKKVANELREPSQVFKPKKKERVKVDYRSLV